VSDCFAYPFLILGCLDVVHRPVPADAAHVGGATPTCTTTSSLSAIRLAPAEIRSGIDFHVRIHVPLAAASCTCFLFIVVTLTQGQRIRRPHSAVQLIPIGFHLGLNANLDALSVSRCLFWAQRKAIEPDATAILCSLFASAYHLINAYPFPSAKRRDRLLLRLVCRVALGATTSRTPGRM
jgi:hypothetical protein